MDFVIDAPYPDAGLRRGSLRQVRGKVQGNPLTLPSPLPTGRQAPGERDRVRGGFWNKSGMTGV
jgi:hypothetical protein